MFNVSANLDLFDLRLPFLKTEYGHKSLVEFKIPLPFRKLGFYLDYNEAWGLGGGVGLTFRSTHNFDAYVTAGPLTLMVDVSKPWRAVPMDWYVPSEPDLLADDTVATEKPAKKSRKKASTGEASLTQTP